MIDTDYYELQDIIPVNNIKIKELIKSVALIKSGHATKLPEMVLCLIISEHAFHLARYSDLYIDTPDEDDNDDLDRAKEVLDDYYKYMKFIYDISSLPEDLEEEFFRFVQVHIDVEITRLKLINECVTDKLKEMKDVTSHENR